MDELISQVWTPQLQTAVTVVLAILVFLYILSVVWTARDAYMRGTRWYIWAVISLVPLLGVIAYLLLRPSLLKIDRDEQELEIALKQRELMHYGECASCGYPVESDYIVCPSCHVRLKNMCTRCGHALDPSWTICPYCATQVGAARQQRPRTTSTPQTGETQQQPRQARPRPTEE